MSGEAIGRKFNAAYRASVLLGLGLLLTTGAAAQKAAPEPVDRPLAPISDTVTEADARRDRFARASERLSAAALERLAARLAARRSDLDARRQRIAREFDSLSAIDRPAGEADLARWRDRAAAGDRQERGMEALRALIGVLTPESLQTVPPAEASTRQALAPDPGLSRTAIDINLRAAPGLPPFAVLKADTLVARLVTDAAGGWSLVAAPSGIGFVPVSQLRREP